MSIPTLFEKIKSFIEGERGKDAFLILTVICVAVCSFVLGRISVVDNKSQNPVVVKFDPSITDYFYKSESSGQVNVPSSSSLKASAGDILETSNNASEYEPEITSEQSSTKTLSSENSQKSDIVASSRGSKYYYTYCSGAKTLSEANKVYFSSEEEAEANGYSLSSPCTKK